MKKFISFLIIFLISSVFSVAREETLSPESKGKGREIILDTETTGLRAGGHINPDRLTEIACLELIDGKATGKVYQTYINPERELSKKAAEITGLTYEFLKKYPKFSEIVDAFLAFIQESPLVIHNATFDVGFLNAELARLGKGPLTNPIVDTVKLARQKFPRQKATLDALCEKFEIDLSSREKGHGALVDCELLRQVYVKLQEEPSRAEDPLERKMARLKVA